MPTEYQAWAEVVADATNELGSLLGRVPCDSWELPAAHVDWDCRRTADHIASVFMHYAAQVMGRSRDHYVKFGFDTSRAETPNELREVVAVAGGLFSMAVGTAAPDAVSWHPHGYFTPAGFAAAGSAEALIHGADIATGLGLAWSPEPGLCEQVLGMVFPDAEREPGASALAALLAQAGRDQRSAGEPARAWSYSAAAVAPLSAREP
jgi:hypothetical protein